MKIILTRKETGILERLRDGMPPKEIGQQMGIKYNTINSCLLVLRAKLQARNSYHAAIQAIRLGLITLYDKDRED